LVHSPARRAEQDRLIVPVSFSLGGHGGSYSTTGQKSPIILRDPATMMFMSTDKIRKRQVEEGTVIFSLYCPVGEPCSIDCDVNVDIAVGDEEFLFSRGELVMPSLHRLIDYTEQTVSLFATELG
jgi:hypothetical protein